MEFPCATSSGLKLYTLEESYWKFRGGGGVSKASVLSSGQTDQQVFASRRKLKSRRDVRQVAKQTRKFPREYTQVAKKDILGRLSSISLADNKLMDVTQFALTWVGWPNSEKLCEFYLDQSERKSTWVHARPGQMKSQVDSSFQSTCNSIWPGL